MNSSSSTIRSQHELSDAREPGARAHASAGGELPLLPAQGGRSFPGAVRAALRVALLYALFAGSWIYFSDSITHRLAPDVEAFAWWSLVKGIAFVGTTAVLLFFLVRQAVRRADKAREESAEAEERLRLLVSATGAMVWRTDAQGQVADAQPVWPEFTGVPAEKLRLREGWFAAIHPDDREQAQEVWSRAIASGTTFGNEFRMRRHDGAWRDIIARGVPIRDRNGQVQEWVGICLDVTERRAADEAVRFQARVLDSVGEAVIATDAAGKVIYMNRYAQTLYGWSSEEGLGRPITDVTVPQSSRADAEAIMNALRQRRSWTGEFSVCTRDGRQFPVHCSNTPLYNEAGELIAIIGVSRDITALKTSENALRDGKSQLHALTTRLNAVREEEAVRIARELHDELGQALTGLTMQVAEVRRKLRSSNGGAPHEVEEQLGGIAELLRQTIETTRRLCTELRPPLLDHLGLGAAIESHAREFEARTGILCDLLLPECGPEMVDEQTATAAFRILQEVLTNAARHSGGTEVKIDLACTGGKLHLRVADNGRGITDEELQNSRGLGVLGMRERAAALGGKVRIERQESGSGTVVALELPLKEQVE